MAQEKTLKIRRAAWSEAAAALLVRTAHDPHNGISTMRALVDTERAELFEVDCDGALVAAYVLQPNQCEYGTELLLVALAGHVPGVSLTRALRPYIEAQAANFDRIRLAARHRGSGRELERMGYSRLAVTYTKELHNERT